MSIFDLDTAIPSNTGGAADVSYVRVVPEGGSVAQQAGQYVSSGLGTTTFNIPANNWYSPAMSNFVLTLNVGKVVSGGAIGAVGADDYVALCDNFIDTFFTQIQTNLNSSTLESIMFPQVVSTLTQYTNPTKNYNSTIGSMSGVGQPFMTRYKQLLSNAGSGATVIEVEFRPPAGFWNLHKLPPGIQSQTIFNWSTDPQCFECPLFNIVMGTGVGQYNISVQQFVLNLATLRPAPGVPLPQEGLITLTSATCIRNNASNTNELSVPITAPAACNRVLVAFQDTNTVAFTSGWATDAGANAVSIKYCAASGPFPVTSFVNAFSANTAASAADVRNMNLNRIQIQAGTRSIQPSPVYNFQGGERDKKRAYADYCTITQGSGKADTGCLAYGNDNLSVGIPMFVLDTTTPANSVVNEGDENAIEVPKIKRSAAGHSWTASVVPSSTYTSPITVTPSGATSFRFSSLTGWAGKYNIYPFDIVRLPGEECGSIQLNAAFAPAPGTSGSSVASIAAYTVMLYDMAIKCTRRADGQYDAQFFALV